jgi:hypothetical protein
MFWSVDPKVGEKAAVEGCIESVSAGEPVV